MFKVKLLSQTEKIRLTGGKKKRNLHLKFKGVQQCTVEINPINKSGNPPPPKTKKPSLKTNLKKEQEIK